MYVIHTQSSAKVEAAISRIDVKEFATIKKSKQFNFDWNKEKEFSVYKLTIGNNQILGLLSLHNRSADYAIEIRLLASSKNNIGDTKQYLRIAGCLIAFACKQAFMAGYDGYVCLKPKTELRVHYQEIYGLVPAGVYLKTEARNSLDLIQKYYED